MSDAKMWLTCQEISDLRLTRFPATDRGVQKWLSRHDVLSRDRRGRGGGKEYHYLSLSLEAIVDYERRCEAPTPALDAIALNKRATLIETAENGRLFALIRQLHVLKPEDSAAIIRQKCLETFGPRVTAHNFKTGRIEKVDMPTLSAFQRILRDVRAYYALGVTTRRLGFDRVFDRFARSRLVVSLGETEVVKLEEHIRSLCTASPGSKAEALASVR